MKARTFLFASLAATSVFAADDTTRETTKFFESEVRPILANRCYECHGDKKQKGGLRMDSIAFLKTGGDTGPALVEGNPDKSPMIEAVRYKNDEFQMPPKEKLPANEIAVLEKWIQMGAPWPESGEKPAVVMEGGFTEEQRKYWCFQPLAKVTPPSTNSTWVRGNIDRFIAQKHNELALVPAPEADRTELLRRVYFDLHGVPPSATEASDFLNDTRPDAYERLIDGLLASPRYGERWAQHWLDLVRYAESDGYNEDAYRPAAWPYRDWVIRSLNADKPYDQFVREQLAGDEIDPSNPDVLIATSYLRNPIYEWNQRDVRGQWDVILTDITDTTGEVFLGLSLGCARCHNHKFDPILQKDYFRLKSFFASVHWRDDLTLATPEEKARFAEQQTAWETATADVRGKIAALIHNPQENAAERARKMFTDDLQAIIAKPASERDALEVQLGSLCERQITRAQKTIDPMKALKSEADKATYKALESELKAFDSLKPKQLLEAFVATDTGTSAPSTTLKTRKGKQEIAPGFLTIIEPKEPLITPLTNSTGRRTALANWITRPDNPLSTRVIVNRLWQYHFGKGLVATASDFGKLGEPPTHPELLDWLAEKFVTDGWSFKKMHREMMLSATYRQTARQQPSEAVSKIDPANRFLWRFSPRRLDAEQVRDALLAASGELDAKSGGPSDEGTSTRRSIYTKKKRNKQTEILQSLDAPAGFASSADRQSTTTPTQALLLLNGDWPLARARKLADRVSTIDDAWIYSLGRLPSQSEKQTAEAFLTKHAGQTKRTKSIVPPPKVKPNEFKENSAQERVLVQPQQKEGDEFTIEAIFTLDSIDINAAVRTIASRWNLGKDSVEGFGWSLGVTGVKSRYIAQTLIVQLVGEDENANIGYEVVPSKVRIELGHRYHVAATISCQTHQVSFRIQDLSTPNSPIATAVVPHAIQSKLGEGASGLVIGGLAKRAAPHHWDGKIDGVRISQGLIEESKWKESQDKWTPGLVTWMPSSKDTHFVWDGANIETVEAGDPFRRAMNDLCQVLLNTNEFFYLH
ncbi:MAG: PSD1 and planctomycete cytochrome C domain-containing protein [Verrucomicrobiota bacterium]